MSEPCKHDQLFFDPAGTHRYICIDCGLKFIALTVELMAIMLTKGKKEDLDAN